MELPSDKNRWTKQDPAWIVFLSKVEQGCLNRNDQSWFSQALLTTPKSLHQVECEDWGERGLMERLKD